MNAGIVLLILKIAVAAVTILWLGSLVALATGRIRLHGRINLAFFFLTLTALFSLEAVVHVVSPGLLDRFLEERGAKDMLRLHLGFSMPAALLFVMLFTGLKHYRAAHISTGILFSLLWIGTFITGIFFLPHE